MTDNEFKCPDCGKIADFEQVEFQLTEEASLTCPVCKSKFAISAILTEPGAASAQPEPIEPEVEEPQEPEGEEAPEGEEKPAEEPAANEPAPEAEGDLQITPKESVAARVSKAMSALKEGKSLVECMKILVVQPIAMLSMNPEVQVEPDDKLNPEEFESKSLKEAKYEDMTPTPSQMRHLLQIITKHCTDKASRDWAKDELSRIQDVRTWKSPRVEEPMAKDKWHDFPRDRVESLNESEEADIAQSINDWVGEDSYSGNDITDLAYAFAMDSSVWSSFQFLVNGVADEYEKEMRANNPSERKLQITCPKKLTVEEKEVKEWEGDFANFNSKLYSACKDLSIPLESYEKVILALQEKEAIDLDKNKVVLDLAKAKSVLVDFLKDQVDTAKEMMSTVVDLKSAPQQAPDLGSAPEPKIGESDEGESVEEKVEAIVKKYFV